MELLLIMKTEKAVDGMMQNSSERLYCSFQWKIVGNQPTVTYLSPD